MTVNPLVVGRLDTGTSNWAGVWIAEDIELLAQGVRDGSWIDIGLGAVSAGLDGLALVSDPIGALLQYGVSWLIEHVRPLTEALERITGDPAAVSAHAQTWRNIAGSLKADASAAAQQAQDGTADWTGAAATAYRNWAGEQQAALTALAKAADTMAVITDAAGMLVATVRALVRDAIATCVSRLISYVLEEVATLGLATPLVIEQVTTLVAAWAAKIARWLRALVVSLRRLGAVVTRLVKLIDEIKAILRRLLGRKPHQDAPSTHAPVDAAAEAQRVTALGMDPATGKFRPAEAATAVRVEEQMGVTLSRAPAGSSADWVDSAGRSYDAVGNFPATYFDKQWPQLQYQIERHLTKADLVPVDVSQFTPEQIAKVVQFIADNNLAPRVFIVGG